ncbi:multidrug resistance-associated protein 1 [Halyomorpha halys]|uniref:multidrug resistance-associated protein 1 n=1 Tax=Halyomorpha halys TaxID=286706 RepID=UPI0006D4CDAD
MSFLDQTNWTALNEFCGSPFWDSNLTWNSDYPQLTPCFEKTVFVWLPCVFLWVFSCIDIFITFNSKSRDIPWNWKNLGKLVVLGLLSTLCAIEFIYNASKAEEVLLVDLYTPLIKLICLVLCSTLVIYHRKHGQRVSGLMFLYWLLVVLLGFSQFYNDLSRHFSSDETESTRIFFFMYYPLCFIMFMLYWLVDSPPIKSEYPKMTNPNPEENASIPSRWTFSWFNGLIYKGFKKPLTTDDLWSMNHQDSASQLYQIFYKYWNKIYKNKIHKNEPAQFTKQANSVDFNGPREVKLEPFSVVPALAKAFGGVFLFASFLQLLDVILTFTSPELLKKVINFVSSDEPKWHGYFYAVLLLFFTSVQSLIQSQFNNRIALVGLRMRTSLMTAVYRKALKLSSSARKDSTLGEIVNLMAVDAQTFMNVMPHLNTLWSAPLQITLSLVFLWQQLGPSVLVGLGVMLIMIPANALFANFIKNFQVKQMKYKDERVKTTNEILSGMKVLKLYAWEPSFEANVQKIREKEAKVLRNSGYLRAALSFVWTCAPFLVSLLTFMTYVLVDERNVLDSAKVFVSLSLFNILKNPLAMVPVMISSMVQASVSIKRINRFLNSEELDLNIISHDEKEDDPLVVEKGTFSWGANEEPTLRNLNLRVKPGSLVAVVGAVGSGKSSFLSAFLGEMHKVSGRVNTKGSIAYVPQLAWIQNCTLQDNILFGRNLDNKKYHKVIDACALKADLQMLPGGDQTEIGERGINVSGGQKQRISLARAVYADCDMYFLDDPLSAVDSHVGKHIFENVISSSGVLNKKTRVLVTHGITFLPEVDLIVVLNDGEISEVGTYRELLEKKGAFSDFLLTHLQDVPEEELEEIDATMKEDLIRSNPDFHRQLSRSRSMKSISSSNSSLSSNLRKRRSSQVSQKSLNEKPKKDKLIVEEKSEEGRVKWSVYSNYFQAVGWFMFSTTAILSGVNQGMLVGSNLWLSSWSDDHSTMINGTQDIGKRNMYLGVYSLFGIGQTIATFFCSLAWYIGCVNAGIHLHNILLLNIMRSPMSFFDTTPQGRILNRFSKEIDVLDNLIPLVMKQVFSFLSPVIGTFIVICYSTPLFTFLILPVGILYYLLQKFYIATSQQLRRIESVSRSPVFSHFSESITGAAVIRAYCVQTRFIKESEEKIDINQTSSYSGVIASRWLAVRLQMIGNLIIFFATIFAILGKDSLSPGIVGLSVSYTLQITGALNILVNMTAEVENNIVAVERIKEYTNTPQEAAWEITPSQVGPDWPQEGKVEFINYKVRYREGLELVLKGIDLAIKGGEKIGIVGRTGAGKSSITLCLFRIIESAEGQILIDGIDISKLGLHALRSRLTIIPQDPVLFSGSLRMNLDPFGRYSDQQVWRALELAHLKSFVRGLPAGLQHEVSEGGENISVGQRQLICLARALLRKTKILILDEATAAVDLETDDFIQRTIRSEFADCTVLTIAHRINTIMDSDRVLVLDQGRVVEFDSPSDLLKNRTSIFHGMARDAGLV